MQGNRDIDARPGKQVICSIKYWRRLNFEEVDESLKNCTAQDSASDSTGQNIETDFEVEVFGLQALG